eukprot:TRINITY_DN2206_c0_g1_i1.p1 TRINITY_DN2206_c0_g1~~TRINITY_DN2206_c0_g1_i1.p1  ORF type:complete len:544 (+),score=167.59 TRINITY_DN2206_c0_g1_i1:47-1633(+)
MAGAMRRAGPIVIDGREGGGQILRNTLAYAALLSKPVRIINIRGSRRPPGFKNQHLAGAQLCGRMSEGAVLDGVKVGSTECQFTPGRYIRGGRHLADPGTAGACTLLFQTALPLSLWAEGGDAELTLKGGTDVGMSPPFDYLRHVFVPYARRFGIDCEFGPLHRGVFPKGGGNVQITVPRVDGTLRAINLLDPGALRAVRGTVFSVGHRQGAAEAAQIRSMVEQKLRSGPIPQGCEVTIREEVGPSAGPGAGVVLAAETTTGCVIGGSALLERRGPTSTPAGLAEAAVAELHKGIRQRACVDEYMQDQLLIFMALAEGRSSVLTGPLTDHTECAMRTAEQMVGVRFETTSARGGNSIISCEGVGYAGLRAGEPVLGGGGAAIGPVGPPAPPPQPAPAPATPPQPAPAPAPAEKRVDSDGKAYTLAEFQSCYGSAAPAKWAAAAGRVEGAPSERRRDDADGRMYTRAEFASYYGEQEAARKWEAGKPAERRVDPADGREYTLADFKACYGADAERRWASAAAAGADDWS